MDADELIARWEVMNLTDQRAVLGQLAAMLRSPHQTFIDNIRAVFADYEVHPDVYAQVAK